MKQTILLLALLLSATSYIYASHLMGGQITARQLHGLTYEVTLTIYRDVNGIVAPVTADMTYTNVASGIYFQSGSIAISPVNPLFNGVEEYTYIDTATFPRSGQYRLSHSTCCRNAAVTNLTNPSNDNIYLYTIVTVDSVTSNSTPVMLNPPATLAPLMQPWVYNPLPYDADGDSLSWSLDAPWDSDTIPCAGYTLPAADSSGPFTLNPYTGELDWTPSTAGNWNATVLVKEYRNGAQIGEIRRDMQIITLPDSGNVNRMAFAASPALQQNNKGFYEYVIPANTPFHLVLNANNANGDTLNIHTVGATFRKATNPSTSTSISAVGHASASFDWTPSTSDISTKPYLDVFRGMAFHAPHVFMSDLTVAITVSSTAPNSLQSIDTKTSITTYPNPTNNHLIVEVNTAQELTASLYLCDLSGRIVTTIIDGAIHTGRTVISTEVQQLPAGVYMLSGICDAQKINSKVVIE